jgi:hypothetical protein
MDRQALQRDNFGDFHNNRGGRGRGRGGGGVPRPMPLMKPRPALLGSEVHVYDFDGTIFRSPVPHSRLDDGAGFLELVAQPSFVPGGLGWYQSKRSMQPPVVPWNPPFTPVWFIMETVLQLKQSIADGHHVVVATGRDFWFKERIEHLLAVAGIMPHVFYTKDKPRGGTVEAKVRMIAGDIAQIAPSRVLIVDDREVQLGRIRDGLAAIFPAVRFDTQLVVSEIMHLDERIERQLLEGLRLDAEKFAVNTRRNEDRRPFPRDARPHVLPIHAPAPALSTEPPRQVSRTEQQDPPL